MRQLNESTGHARCIMVSKEMIKPEAGFTLHGQNDRAFIRNQVTLNLEYDNEETVFCHSDILPSRTRRDADDVKKPATQLREFDVSRLRMKSAEEDGDTYSETMDKPLVFLPTKDIAPCEVASDRLTAEERDMQAVIVNVKELLAEATTGFYDN